MYKRVFIASLLAISFQSLSVSAERMVERIECVFQAKCPELWLQDKLICRGERIIEELDALIDERHPYRASYDELKEFFTKIGVFSIKLRYRQYEYPAPGDLACEAAIIQRVMLFTKDSNLCTPAELEQKNAIQQKHEQVSHALKAHRFFYSFIVDNPFFLFFFE